MHKDFAIIIRDYDRIGALRCAFWSYDAAGEKRSPITGALLKSKGLAKGRPDYEFIKIIDNIANHIFIEFKCGKNKQSQEQKDFQKMCAGTSNLKYGLCYSIDEALAFLKEYHIIR